MSIPVNVSELQQYCNFLSQGLCAATDLNHSYTPVFTWAFLDAHSNGVVKGLGTYVGSIEEMLNKYHGYILSQQLSQQSASGAQSSASDTDSVGTGGTVSVSAPTVHITLNQTNDSGRKNSDIIACRVFCVDLDYVLTEETIAAWIPYYSIELVVESSPGKYHLYWACDPSIRFEDWVQVQTALAGYFEGDLNLRSLCKTIRVPGFQRITKSGETFVPRIVYQLPASITEASINLGYSPGIRPMFLNDELMKKSLELASQRMAADKKLQKKLSKEVKKRLAAPNTEGTQRSALETPGIGRNTTLYNLVKEHVLTLDPDTTYSVGEDKALTYGYQVNNEFSEPLEASEVEQTVRSAYGAALSTLERRLSTLESAKQQIAQCLSEPVQGLSNGLTGPSKLLNTDFNGVTSMENGAITNGHYPDSDMAALDITESVSSKLSDFSYNLKHKAIASSWFSDQAIIERVLQRYHTFILNCDDTIMAFNPYDKTWKSQSPDMSAEIKHFCLEVLIEAVNNPDIVYECLTKDGEVSEDKLRKFKDKLLSAGMQMRIASAVKCSLSHPKLYKSDFDAVGHLFYCADGVLNMLTGELREPLPTDYLLSKSNVKYAPDAGCPGFKAFLAEVFANNESPESMISLIQEVFGYSLGGAINEQKVFIHLGGGSNGKSKVLTALTKLSGGYARFMPPDELTKGKSFGKAFEELGAKLEGHRLCVIDDLDTEGVWNESFVKNITSPRVWARGKYEKGREFANRAKVHLGVNKAPKSSAESYGLLRRLCIIPYSRTFEPIAEVSDAIDSMIDTELSGILNWAIEGYKRWKLHGLTKSLEVQAAVADYRSENFVQDSLIREIMVPLAPSEQNESSGEFVHDIYDRYAMECSLRGQKVEFNQMRLIKYLSEIYNMRPKKFWNKANKLPINKLQIKFKQV